MRTLITRTLVITGLVMALPTAWQAMRAYEMARVDRTCAVVLAHALRHGTRTDCQVAMRLTRDAMAAPSVGMADALAITYALYLHR